jgi:uncharacterized alkaline shock family protein YloU
VEGQPQISPEVLARYAGDAAREVSGVAGLAETAKISSSSDSTAVTIHLELEWGSPAEDVARKVQTRVAEYLERMANLTVGSVDVVFDSVSAPPAKQ